MRKTVISFRLDDICPRMHRKNFESVISLLDAYGVDPLLGVVPDNQDPKLNVEEDAVEDFWERMLQLQEHGCCVAQHGYTHTYHTKSGGILRISNKSEFANRPYWEQLQDLRTGKQILQSHGLDPTVFMAPSHSFDNHTIAALKELNFRSITDGLTDYIYESNGIRFVPCKNVVSMRRRLGGICVVCLHTNNMNAESIAQLGRFLEKYKEYVCSYRALLSIKAVQPSSLALKIAYIRHHVSAFLYELAGTMIAIILGGTKK